MAKFKDVEKVLDLVAKTGDKVIIVSENQDPFVIMSFRDYDRLILGHSPVNQMTEQQLLDKINRDIAVWKSVQEDDSFDLDDFKVDNLDQIDSLKSAQNQTPIDTAKESVDQEEDKYYLEPVD